MLDHAHLLDGRGGDDGVAVAAADDADAHGEVQQPHALVRPHPAAGAALQDMLREAADAACNVLLPEHGGGGHAEKRGGGG
jgi:hypothetical protein